MKIFIWDVSKHRSPSSSTQKKPMCCLVLLSAFVPLSLAPAGAPGTSGRRGRWKGRGKGKGGTKGGRRDGELVGDRKKGEKLEDMEKGGWSRDKRGLDHRNERKGGGEGGRTHSWWDFYRKSPWMGQNTLANPPHSNKRCSRRYFAWGGELAVCLFWIHVDFGKFQTNKTNQRPWERNFAAEFPRELLSRCVNLFVILHLDDSACVIFSSERHIASLWQC